MQKWKTLTEEEADSLFDLMKFHEAQASAELRNLDDSVELHAASKEFWHHYYGREEIAGKLAREAPPGYHAAEERWSARQAAKEAGGA